MGLSEGEEFVLKYDEGREVRVLLKTIDYQPEAAKRRSAGTLTLSRLPSQQTDVEIDSRSRFWSASPRDCPGRRLERSRTFCRLRHRNRTSGGDGASVHGSAVADRKMHELSVRPVPCSPH